MNLWRINLFERIALDGFKVRYQNLVINVDTGMTRWHNEPWSDFWRYRWKRSH